MPDPHSVIRARFGVRSGDIPPYRGWRSSTRETLAACLAALGYTSGAEIGVQQGVYSEMLCRAIPGLALLCVDPWWAYMNGSRTKAHASTAEAYYQETRRRLAPYASTIWRMTSMEAVIRVPAGSLDFVVLDADHEFDPTMLDLIHWSQRVRPGGLVIAHDYEVAYRVGVIEAVNAYTRAHGIRDWYVTRDRVPYAFWVRPEEGQ